jgi:predicted Zn-dependent protease
VTKQHCNVSQLVVLISVNSLVILCKGLLEEVAPQTVDLGKALTNHAKELGVSLFLGATLDNH